MTFKLSQVNGPQKNADPLKQAEDVRRELFGRYSKASAGFQHRDVVYAAVNLMLNAIRQNCKTQREAEVAFDEMIAHAKRSLLDLHYFPNGKRRNVFPFDQVIEPSLLNSKSKFPQ